MIAEELTKEMRWKLADQLAEERLEAVNMLCEEVIPHENIYSKYVKRIIDIIVSGLALIVTLPINLVIGIVTYFDVGRPIFFKQERVGKEGKIFVLIKFRNMRNTVDERGELLPPDQRVTEFGKFVRKTSLDELLNFWSIFKGDMSLLGPRPLVPEYTHRYNKRHKMRLAVRPGLECPPRKVSDHPVTWQEQFENDVWYVENVGAKTDIYMMIQLVKYVFNRKNAKVRSIGRGTFMGYSWDGRAINLVELTKEGINYEKITNRAYALEAIAAVTVESVGSMRLSG
ncbi:sugar transferase [Desulfosporosinus youngiae]|uniref:Glycosyl transferase possibly involved in lipopolysaccharide synthesis n=1 Tax=Desulfosporosinus youngiae DSM 17734 TaxID=768710 RepID=H5XZF8_9FIRM|nr:sugar transferase [Desulfosporosinus youngiae]EHQ91864.1 glycosyl transferase possibly involved in lipopolysaccharide synthesis [Desulfosporosinus youngiae DSM 17734]